MILSGKFHFMIFQKIKKNKIKRKSDCSSRYYEPNNKRQG